MFRVLYREVTGERPDFDVPEESVRFARGQRSLSQCQDFDVSEESVKFARGQRSH